MRQREDLYFQSSHSSGSLQIGKSVAIRDSTLEVVLYYWMRIHVVRDYQTSSENSNRAPITRSIRREQIFTRLLRSTEDTDASSKASKLISIQHTVPPSNIFPRIHMPTSFRRGG